MKGYREMKSRAEKHVTSYMVKGDTIYIHIKGNHPHKSRYQFKESTQPHLGFLNRTGCIIVCGK